MNFVLALVVGSLYAAGVYLMLRRNIVRLVLGLLLLGHGANLLIFSAAGVTRGRPPLLAQEAEKAPLPLVDPLPQALILTAIVIGFAVLAYALVLAERVHRVLGTDDADRLRETGP